MNTGVYTITNLVNGKIYVGSTQLSFDYRMRSHFNELRRNVHKNKHLQSSYNKYGKNNFIFEILEECQKEYCLSTEQYWINMLNVCDRKYGYNICSIPNSSFGIKRSLECRLKMSENRKGEKHHFYGKHFSKEHKKNLSISHKKNILLKKPRRRKLSISERYLGEGNPFFGKKHSKETIEKIAEYNRTHFHPHPKLRKSILQYNLNGEFIQEFESINQTSEKTGISLTTLQRNLHGYTKSKSFIFKYKNVEILSAL